MRKDIDNLIHKTNIGLETRAEYNSLIHKMIGNRVDKEYISDSDEASKELAEGLQKVIDVISYERRKIRGMIAVNSKEADYINENCDPDYRKIQTDRLWRKNTYLSKFETAWTSEIKLMFAVEKCLESINVCGKLEKAIRYTIKSTMKRFKAPNNPVQILLRENLAHNAYSSYATKLARENKDVWTDLCEGRDYMEVVEYCYKNNKLGFVKRRDAFFEQYEARREAEAEKKKQAIQERRIATVKRRIAKYTRNVTENLVSLDGRVRGYPELMKCPHKNIFVVISSKDCRDGFVNQSGGITSDISKALVYETYNDAKEDMKNYDFLDYSIYRVL